MMHSGSSAAVDAGCDGPGSEALANRLPQASIGPRVLVQRTCVLARALSLNFLIVKFFSDKTLFCFKHTCLCARGELPGLWAGTCEEGGGSVSEVEAMNE